MSGRKRKLATDSTDLVDSFNAIKEILIRIKPKLTDIRENARSSLCDDLYRISAIAESYTQLRRQHSPGDLGQEMDVLDREGVNLWNAAGLIRAGPDDDGRPLIAALRLSGFRLIEAGLERSPTIETLIHVLQLASKTGASLSETGNKDVAATVLACAAKLEERLRSMEDVPGVHQKPKVQAIMLYYSSRMEAAWREGNDGVADFMLQKITENDQYSLLVSRDRQVFAAKLLEIGKSLLRENKKGDAVTTNGARACDAVKWVQKAFTMTEQIDDTESPGIAELKKSILRTLARAYYISSSQDPENLTRAEATLQELISDTPSQGNPEYQQLRWMRLAILKRQKPGASVLLEAFQSIIDHMVFTESDVADILRELRTLNQEHELVTAVLLHHTQHCIESEGNAGLAFVDQLLLSIIFHCSKDEDHSRAIRDMEKAFSCVKNAGCELSKVSVTACLTLLWQFGDRNYQAKKWNIAVDWFLGGTHQLFTPAQGSMKCFRKAALCYIQQREYARASALIRQCPGNEAATHYVSLLTAVKQGLEDEAIKAVQQMSRLPDFDRKMLLLATRMAHESGMKALLLTVLEYLLRTLKCGENLEADIEAITLIRCIIRIVISLLDESISNQTVLIPSLVEHFRTAKKLVSTASARKSVPAASRDISWLWRSAYNAAVKGCSEWANAETHVSDLFDLSRQFLEVYCDTAVHDADAEVYNHIAIASFASVAGRVFTIRQAASDNSPEQIKELIRTIAQDVQAAKIRIAQILSDNRITNEQEIARCRSYIDTLLIFEVELFCGLKEWKHVLGIVKVTRQELGKADTISVDTLESIADILWVAADCSVDVLFTALEAILHASLDHNTLSIVKFSRWLRAICTILLSRDTVADRAKAVGFVEQAISVLEEHGGNTITEEAYPVDERQWLLSSAYNTGIECLHGCSLDEARRWFEASTVICRFVPDGKNRADKISETYSYLLSRYRAPQDHSAV